MVTGHPYVNPTHPCADDVNADRGMPELLFYLLGDRVLHLGFNNGDGALWYSRESDAGLAWQHIALREAFLLGAKIGIYAGVIVMSNWFMMMLYLPSVVVVAARWRKFGCCGVNKCREVLGGAPSGGATAPRSHVAPSDDDDNEGRGEAAAGSGLQLAVHDDQASDGVDTSPLPAKSPARSLPTATSGQREMRPLERAFSTHITRAVLRWWPALLVVITPFVIAMAYVTLVSPKLSLPSTNEFQLFTMDQPMEQYDLNHKPTPPASGA